MIEINTIFKFEDKEKNQKKSYFEINFATILKIDDGYVDIFKSSNQAYSYIIKDNDNYLHDIVEKILVSENASSGLYGFKNSSIFLEFFNDKYKYISEIYQNMVLR